MIIVCHSTLCYIHSWQNVTGERQLLLFSIFIFVSIFSSILFLFFFLNLVVILAILLFSSILLVYYAHISYTVLQYFPTWDENIPQKNSSHQLVRIQKYKHSNNHFSSHYSFLFSFTLFGFVVNSFRLSEVTETGLHSISMGLETLSNEYWFKLTAYFV
jgi:hypothetical protein